MTAFPKADVQYIGIESGLMSAYGRKRTSVNS